VRLSTDMDPRPSYMSIWDVAHHWHDLPSPNEDAPLLPAVRDTITALLESVLAGEIELYAVGLFTVTSSARPGEWKEMGAYPLDQHPTDLQQLFETGIYTRDVLASYRLKVEDLFYWGARASSSLPDFVIPDW